MPGAAVAHPDLIARAVRQHRAASRQGVLELLFTWAFSGLVYPQIWEDPEIDLEAMALTPDCRVLTIASGGCNVLSYLVADPAQIIAVDLNRAHIALNRLKLAALRHLPSWQIFFRFFGKADDRANVALYWRWLAPHLDAKSRAYWEKRTWRGLGRRRLSVFARNVYRYGLLGRCIGLGHFLARLHGIDPADVMRARTLSEQRAFFDTALAPIFDRPAVRWLAGRELALYGLGIPPAQFRLLAGNAGMAGTIRARLRRLACEFPLDQNYFAWQAFARRYEGEGGPLPLYLRPENFEALRARAGRVDLRNTSFTDCLAREPDRSLDRFVLLDAQDWMTDAQLNRLWREITRTARPGARVIFRTAAEPSLLPGRVDDAILGRWRYEAEASRQWTRRDRSAVYGGFHLYILAD
jgi:S-adenosylmethionine-diacylglycerol 3-amino-3-carboxypropyl transferase